MPLDNAWNMYIFRDGKQVHNGPKLLGEFLSKLEQYSPLGTPSEERTRLLDLLLRAGELECALADENSPQTSLLCAITDELAASLVTKSPLPANDLANRGRTIAVP